ncbi:MAG: SPOR domain-containing protein [Gammaproteobacteria bacterium]|uniref:SPOR domain-containing protein n=1 Tax=Rhodoferax sp. TaxID=50421 RepID=UPI0017C7B289|nr:SPOR domain-containing protein [Rhodoferax sp.]MBU3898943.1 SPOR domain-containing protein [Gammaproteobacteria bacterium]MBA3059290.1 SPOR domain-containing protein [Rhodoferax sp.]MBU3997508.1 SPOR domain-containing protein [Gammaproteobacteria bacterium]MBU4018386.1 SPOR domain-containing protein [Gammaproteobacteria bacterium]MBU4080399.1 SPOR domain-containing protein [Gammaproteobacteria bacterium]
MAFFKLRKGSDDRSGAPAPSESVEVMRKRAKYRLLGAAVLVLLGVIAFPLLFDKQPRPIAVDTPIEIPDRNKVLPLSIPAPAVSLSSESTALPAVAASAQNIEQKEALARLEYKQEAIEKIVKEEPKAANPLPDASTTKANDKPVVKAPAKTADAAKAQALLDGKSLASGPDAQASASEGRFVVQIGAFADAARAREVRLKVERAGLKTYTHVAKTKDGDRTRVRVGPFGTKAEADKAAEIIKKLSLPAAVLTL